MGLQLSAAQAAFLQGPVSINVAATGGDGWPLVCRAQGCVVARDRKSVTVMLSARRGRELLLALDAGSVLACAFSRPATHATLQLKAHTSTRVAVSALYRDYAAQGIQAFANELAGLGYGEALAVAAVAAVAANDLIAIRFCPEIM